MNARHFQDMPRVDTLRYDIIGTKRAYFIYLHAHNNSFSSLSFCFTLILYIFIIIMASLLVVSFWIAMLSWYSKG